MIKNILNIPLYRMLFGVIFSCIPFGYYLNGYSDNIIYLILGSSIVTLTSLSIVLKWRV